MITRPDRILSHWKREKPKKKGADMGKLTPAEQAHARNALRYTTKKHGSYEALAEALGVSRTTVAQSASIYPVSPELVLRLANLEGVAVTAILTGEWPTPRKCPTCGRDWEH